MNNTSVATIHEDLNHSIGGGFTSQGLVEIYGDEGAGKTATAISLSHYAEVGYIDLDGTFPHQLEHIVGRSDQLLLCQLTPDVSVENLSEMVEAMCSNLPVVVIDPLGCLEWEKVEALGPILSRMSKQYNCLIVLVNHANAFNESPNERITSFYCKQRVQVQKTEANEKGMQIEFRVTKNLLYPPFKYGTIDIQFQEEELLR